MAHCAQEMVIPVTDAAKFTDNGLAAMAVMNIPEEIVDVWNIVVMTYAPIFFSVLFAGSEPHATHNALARGKKIPPARAAKDGIAGASNASENTKEYVNPSVDLPNMLTILYAMRLPRPVLMNPRAKKNASAINQGISLENAENAALNGNKPVVMATPKPIIAVAPSGSGFVMIPTIVPTNTASKCHAFALTPAGAGMSQINNPASTEYPRGFSLAPFQFASAPPSAPARTTGAEDDADARVTSASARLRRCVVVIIVANASHCAAVNTARDASRASFAPARATAPLARGAIAVRVTDDRRCATAECAAVRGVAARVTEDAMWRKRSYERADSSG